MEQQQKLLFSFGRLDNKYKRLAKPLLEEMAQQFVMDPDRLLENGANGHAEGSKKTVQFPQTEELVKKSINFMKSFRDVPRRLKWATFDHAKMEALIVKLADFNDKMHNALDKAQMDLLLDMQNRTNDQIVLLNRTMSHMVQIYRSDQLTFRNQHAITDLEDSGYEDLFGNAGPVTRDAASQPLAALAQQKFVHLAIEDSQELSEGFADEIGLQHLANDIRQIELLFEDIRPKEGRHFPIDIEEGQRTEAFYQNTPVWVEWKTPDSTGPMQHDGGVDPKIHARVKKLAALLSKHNRTVKFRAPHCRGYFIDEEDGRFGLVFEKPFSVHPFTTPTSLHTLISSFRSGDSRHPMPPLASRITLMRLLAETVERLHAVDWLHKGLRSANILLFAGPDGSYTYTDPYLSGFDYSRPATSDDMTERPLDNPAADIYRHPSVQHKGNREDASGRESYKKSFDLYALGIVLLEIACWNTIDRILGIDLDAARPKDTWAVEKRLLEREPQHLQFVRDYMGDGLEGVIRACLVGPEAFGLPAECDERREVVAAGLHRAFGEKVVKKLGLMMAMMKDM